MSVHVLLSVLLPLSPLTTAHREERERSRHRGVRRDRDITLLEKEVGFKERERHALSHCPLSALPPNALPPACPNAKM